MKKYNKPLFEEIIVASEDVILSSGIEVKESNATFGATTPDEVF